MIISSLFNSTSDINIQVLVHSFGLAGKGPNSSPTTSSPDHNPTNLPVAMLTRLTQSDGDSFIAPRDMVPLMMMGESSLSRPRSVGNPRLINGFCWMPQVPICHWLICLTSANQPLPLLRPVRRSSMNTLLTGRILHATYQPG